MASVRCHIVSYAEIKVVEAKVYKSWLRGQEVPGYIELVELAKVPPTSAPIS